MLERFLPDLGRFSGLKQLQLQAEMIRVDDEEEFEWDVKAVLRPALLAHLQSQLESLSAVNFYDVTLVEAGAASGEAGAAGAGAAGSTSPAQLLPCITQLNIRNSRVVLLDMPLPILRALVIQECSIVHLEAERLWLLQLTSLYLGDWFNAASVRCAAMPALTRLNCGCQLVAVDTFSERKERKKER